jgi:hypothetical protein
MRKPTPKKLQAECDRFNRQFPVGTKVRTGTGHVGDGPGKPGTVREPAYVLQGHTAVAAIDGVRGCVAVSHIAAMPDDDVEVAPAMFLRDLAERLMRVPAFYGVDQGDVDRLNAIAADMTEEDAIAVARREARGRVGGRIRVVTQADEARAIKLLRSGVGVADVARELGVSKSLIHQRRRGEWAPRIAEASDDEDE